MGGGPIATRKISRKIVVSNDCEVAQAVKTVCEGFKEKILNSLLKDLSVKNTNKVEINHVKDKVYYIKNKNKGVFMEIPEVITKLGLSIMFEYLAKNPKLCNKCCLFGNKDACPKNFFV